MIEHPADRRRRILSQVFATPADAAFVLGRDKTTVNRWVTGRKITEFRLDGQRYVRLSEATKYNTHAPP